MNTEIKTKHKFIWCDAFRAHPHDAFRACAMVGQHPILFTHVGICVWQEELGVESDSLVVRVSCWGNGKFWNYIGVMITQHVDVLNNQNGNFM